MQIEKYRRSALKQLSKIKDGTVVKTPCTILFVLVMIMLVNNADLKKEELNSFAHKVRAIVFNKDNGYYLESSNFDLHETELLKSIIAESNISDAKKQALVRKLIKQQHNPTKTSFRKFLREETK